MFIKNVKNLTESIFTLITCTAQFYNINPLHSLKLFSYVSNKEGNVQVISSVFT